MLGPFGAQVGPSWLTWGLLEVILAPSWLNMPHLGPNLAQHEAKMTSTEPSWPQHDPNLEPQMLKNSTKTSEILIFSNSLHFHSMGSSWANLEPTWGQLWPTWLGLWTLCKTTKARWRVCEAAGYIDRSDYIIYWFFDIFLDCSIYFSGVFYIFL